METTFLDKGINIIYIEAKSFPDGVLEAHQKLHSLIPFSAERKYFGISRPEKETIIYKAAAEEMIEGEGEKLNCETLILKKGKYIFETVENYRKDIPSIGNTFRQLLSQPNIDKQGYCVEWYINENDVKCMVRLEN